MTSAENDAVRSQFADDADFRDLLETYVGSMKQKIEDCRSARKSEKYDELKVLTHQIKGSGTGYGFPEVSKLAGEAEAEYINENYEEANTRLQKLIDYLRRIEL